MNAPFADPLPPALHSGAAPVPRGLALGSIAAFWAFYFLINTAQAAIAEAPNQLDMLMRRAVVAVIGIALTALLMLVLERRAHWPIRRLIALVFAACLPLAIAYGAVNQTVFLLIAPSPELLEEMARYPEKLNNPWLGALGLAVNWYFFVVAWGVLYIALAYAERVRGVERQAARYRAEAQAAELRALRYQINPHFLFNTLNSLSALVLAGRNDDAERMILNLSIFFRSSLARETAADVPLADEIALQRLYLEIEKVRFPDRLKIAFDIPDSLADAAVPGLILQPIIENAIKHGVARSRHPVTLTIRAREAAGELQLSVEDDGEGDAPAAPGTGTGVRNVCDRLAARFGSRARCVAGPGRAGGWQVVLTMPRLRAWA